MDCPNCGAVLTEILASHDYTLELKSETDKWVKGDGDVTYLCSNCMEGLGFSDIRDILIQVDEL